MPEVELDIENDDVDLEEEVLEEESVDDDDDDVVEETTTTTTKKRKKRQTFSDDNVYVYKDKLEAKKASKNLKYTDGTVVPDMRVWEISKGGKIDEDSGNRVDHEVLGYVVQKTNGQAAQCFLESQKINIELAYRKSARGRSKSKIDPMILMYGKLLQATCMKPNTFEFAEGAKKDIVQQWKAGFAQGAVNSHYIDWEAEGGPKWKEVTE